MDYRYQEDIQLVRELLDRPLDDIADEIGVTHATPHRWLNGTSQPRETALDAFYNFAHSQGISLNRIKAQLYQEEISCSAERLLFHGSKPGIEGPLSPTASRANNDFGQGFYCGETLDQAAMFVTHFPKSSLYMLAFDPHGLQSVEFSVDQNWMLTIASFRGTLHEYTDHPAIAQLRGRVAKADYLIAPIADNRMFEIIDSFIMGEITDLQCQHSLSATNLGQQYVLRTKKAVSQARLLEHCFLCSAERTRYEQARREETSVGLTKVKVAKRQYRNQGRYIEEILS